MSEITSYYVSWLGNPSFGATSIRFRNPEPIVFSPLDISGCRLWLNANNSDSVFFNNLLEVSGWSNLGTVGGTFDTSGNALINYGTTLINGLNVLSFPNNAFMQGTFQFNFQPRSIFFVSRENTIESGILNPWITSDTTGGMETFSQANGSQIYFLGKHPSPIPELAFSTPTIYTGYTALVTFINDIDISNNWMGVNGTQYPAIYEIAASNYNTSSIKYYLGGYYNTSTISSSQDICELIMYEGALNAFDRDQVNTYLKTKWAIVEPPPPPPPPPFVPTDISGLYYWLDASNSDTITLSNSFVSSWSNQGIAGGAYITGCNNASTITTDGFTFVDFPTETTMNYTGAFPYYSRTAFCVFKLVSELSNDSYPYMNLTYSEDTGARTFGISYDSNNNSFATVLCQSGINCPGAAFIPATVAGDLNLAIWACLSNTTASNSCFWNGDSNRNISTDLGNLFAQGTTNYYIGSPVVGSPNFQIGEILEYNDYLTTAQISNVANYLVTKWAISSFIPFV